MSALQDKMKHTIDEIEGLPEGWKAVAYRLPKHGETCWHQNFGIYTATVSLAACFIVEKIQPRRIVLEETTESTNTEWSSQNWILSKNGDNAEIRVRSNKVWREVKEPDTVKMGVSQGDGAEPKLSLSVDECKHIYKWMDSVGLHFNKITEFIKEN